MVDVAQLVERKIVALVVESSILSIHPKYIGVWCNGSMPVSKTVDGGSNPSTPANYVRKIFFDFLKIL